MLGYSVGILQIWWFLVQLDQPVSAAIASGTWVLGSWFDFMAFAVPLNLGTLEGGRVLAFGANGYSVSLGMTYGVALRVTQLSCACLGRLSYALPVAQIGRSAVGSAQRLSMNG